MTAFTTEAPAPSGDANVFRRVKEFEFTGVPIDAVVRDRRLDLNPDIKQKGYVEVRVGTSETVIQAKGFIGVIPVNDRLTLEVVPRVPLSNIARLLYVAQESPILFTRALRQYDAEGEMYPTLSAVYAVGLREAIADVVDKGLYKEYQRVEESTSFPRGRLQVGRTVQRHLSQGVRHRADVTYFQRSLDNPVNRCLLYAVWHLSQYVDRIEGSLRVGQRHRIRRDLNAAWQMLPGVHLDRSEAFLDDGMVTGAQPMPPLRNYYRSALNLALVVIGRRAVIVERHGRELQLSSLVIDMSTVFETYLRRVLAAGAARAGWDADVVDGNVEPPGGGAGHVFDDNDDVRATPDIVVRRDRNGQATEYPLLIEVKYKPAVPGLVRHDLNQAITYAVAYSSPVAVIAQPKAEHSLLGTGLRRLGRVGNTVVYQYVVDLASRDLEQEEERLVTEVGALAIGDANAIETSTRRSSLTTFQ